MIELLSTFTTSLKVRSILISLAAIMIYGPKIYSSLETHCSLPTLVYQDSSNHQKALERYSSKEPGIIAHQSVRILTIICFQNLVYVDQATSGRLHNGGGCYVYDSRPRWGREVQECARF